MNGIEDLVVEPGTAVFLRIQDILERESCNY